MTDRRDQLADQARQLASAGFSYATAQDFDGCVRHIARELDDMIREAQADALEAAAMASPVPLNYPALLLRRAAALRGVADPSSEGAGGADTGSTMCT